MPTFGDTSSGSENFPMSEDRCLVDRFTLSESGTVDSGHAYSGSSFTGSGANWKFVLFTDSSGPSSLLGASDEVAIESGAAWQIFTGGTLTGLSLSAGDYWLGVVANSFEASLGEDLTGVSPDVCMANGTFSFASPPSTWPGTDVNYSVGLNVYITYTVAGGGQPITKRLGGISHMPRNIRRGYW